MKHLTALSAFSVLSLMLLANGSSARAQGPEQGDGPPPPRPPMGMRPMRWGPPPVSLATLPLEVLAAETGLSMDQHDQIAAIQRRVRGPRMGGPGVPPRGRGFDGNGGGPGGIPGDGGPGGPDGGPGGPGGPDGGPGGPGGHGEGREGDIPGGPDGGTDGGLRRPGIPPPPRGPMGAGSPEMQRADREINALLTDTQKRKAASLVRLARALQRERIPAQLIMELKLTGSQRTDLEKIAETARVEAPIPPPQDGTGASFRGGPPPVGPPGRALHEKAMAVLTPEQRQIVQRFESTRGPGGRFGRQGRGTGGPGGRQGDEFGGPGGPPPGSDGSAPPPPDPGDLGNPPPPPDNGDDGSDSPPPPPPDSNPR